MNPENHQSNEEWLSEKDWMYEEKTKSLSIPGLALPGLRDLRILFIALIEFDLLLGPIVHINEISRGSSYIERLRDYRTIADVYAGLARSDIDELSTLEDSIALFRYNHGGEADTVSVLIISCIPGTDLDQVKELGSNALFKAKADPEILGQKLSSYLRERLITTKKFRSEHVKDKIVILDENRVSKPLDFPIIKGIVIVDHQSKLADFRLFPTWLEGKEIIEMEFINYIDKLATSIKEDRVTSLIYQDTVLLATRIEATNTFIVISFGGNDILELKKISEWFIPYSMQLTKHWKFSTPSEILISLEFMDSSIRRGSIIEDFTNYVVMALRASKLKPTINPHLDFDSVENTILPDDQWEFIMDLDGTKSVSDLVKTSGMKTTTIIPLLEWARIRDIILYFEE